MTGTEWQVDKDERKLIPHKIRTYKFVQGSDQTLLTDRSGVYIAVDKDNYYYQDQAISIAFTEKVMDRIRPHQGTTLAGYDGIPLGAMISYFGARPPKGYRWCNGNDPKDHPKGDNVFPHSDWVPKHLVGTPLPDMREQLAGGSKDETDVGRIHKHVNKQVTVPESVIEGSNFTMPKEVRGVERIQGDSFVFRWRMEPNALGKVDAQPMRDLAVRARYDPVEALDVSYKYPGGIGGKQTIPARTLSLQGPESLPRHVMCRWIIRVE